MWDFFFWSSLPAIDRWRENAVFTVFFLHSNYKMHHTSLFSHCGKQMRRLPQRAALMFCAKRCLAKSRRWSFHYLDSVETVLLYFTLRRWRSTGTEQVKQRVTKAAPRATHLHCILSPRPQSAFQLPAQHTERAHKCSWDTHITTHWWNTQRTGCRACAHFSFRNIYLGVDDSRTKPLQQWTFE